MTEKKAEKIRKRYEDLIKMEEEERVNIFRKKKVSFSFPNLMEDFRRGNRGEFPDCKEMTGMILKEEYGDSCLEAWKKSVYLHHEKGIGSTWTKDKYVAPEIGQLVYRREDCKVEELGRIIGLVEKKLSEWSRSGDTIYYNFYGYWNVKVKWLNGGETVEDTYWLKGLRHTIDETEVELKKRLESLDKRLGYLKSREISAEDIGK